MCVCTAASSKQSAQEKTAPPPSRTAAPPSALPNLTPQTSHTLKSLLFDCNPSQFSTGKERQISDTFKVLIFDFGFCLCFLAFSVLAACVFALRLCCFFCSFRHPEFFGSGRKTRDGRTHRAENDGAESRVVDQVVQRDSVLCRKTLSGETMHSEARRNKKQTLSSGLVAEHQRCQQPNPVLKQGKRTATNLKQPMEPFASSSCSNLSFLTTERTGAYPWLTGQQRVRLFSVFGIVFECFLFSAWSVFCFGHKRHTAVMHHKARAQHKCVAIHLPSIQVCHWSV